MTDWYNEDADWINDGEVDGDSIYPNVLCWLPVSDDDETSGSGDSGIYVWI